MRLFIALDIPDQIRERLSQYVERVRRFAPDARWARIESLHVTLKFIGEVPESKVQEIKTALATVKAQPVDVEFKDIGFFPTPRSARVFWAGVNASDALPQLASSVEDAVEKLGIPREKRAYHAHLTLARAPEGGASKHCFRLLQEKLGGGRTPAIRYNVCSRILFVPKPDYAGWRALYQAATLHTAIAGRESVSLKLTHYPIAEWNFTTSSL